MNSVEFDVTVPTDVWIMILSYLNLFSIFRISTVSKNFLNRIVYQSVTSLVFFAMEGSHPNIFNSDFYNDYLSDEILKILIIASYEAGITSNDFHAHSCYAKGNLYTETAVNP